MLTGTDLLDGKLKFPIAGVFNVKIAGACAAILVPMNSIFIGLPSSCTLLYLLRAARASDLLTNTTSAVP